MWESTFCFSFNSFSVKFIVSGRRRLHVSPAFPQPTPPCRQVQLTQLTLLVQGVACLQKPWHQQTAPNQARMQEIKYLLPVTSARAWQAAWDSPLMHRAGTAERRM